MDDNCYRLWSHDFRSSQESVIARTAGMASIYLPWDRILFLLSDTSDHPVVRRSLDPGMPESPWYPFSFNPPSLAADYRHRDLPRVLLVG